MTQYEFMKMAERVLKVAASKEIRVQDVKHLQLYEDYRRLKGEGLKVTYIVDYLCVQYGVPVASIYRIVKRMGRKI